MKDVYVVDRRKLYIITQNNGGFLRIEQWVPFLAEIELQRGSMTPVT